MCRIEGDPQAQEGASPGDSHGDTPDGNVISQGNARLISLEARFSALETSTKEENAVLRQHILLLEERIHGLERALNSNSGRNKGQ